VTIRPAFAQFTQEVRGTGEFPLDMLRHDQCWGLRDEDEREIQLTYQDGLSLNKVRYIRLGFPWKPNKERWESFGWKIMGVQEAALERVDLKRAASAITKVAQQTEDARYLDGAMF
jgi:hypothetical protein